MGTLVPQLDVRNPEFYHALAKPWQEIYTPKDGNQDWGKLSGMINQWHLQHCVFMQSKLLL